jgi:O-antigen ligase
MSLFSLQQTPSEAALRRGGAALLWAGLAAGLGLLFALLWWAPGLLPVLPALLVGGAGVVYLLGRPLQHLCLTLLASALILEHEPGVQPTEVLYGLYCVFFLAAWGFDAAVLRRARPFASRESRALLWFLLLVGALLPLSFFFGGTARTVGRELIALVMLGFFFPIREACVRYRHGARALLLVALALSVFVVFRNLVMYQTLLSSAAGLWEMVQGRIVANDHVLAASSLFTFVFLLHAASVRQVAGYLLAFVLCFSGLLLTQGRAFWLAFAFGVFFLFVVVERRRRGHVLLFGGAAAVVVLAVGLAFFGDFVTLLLGGLLERLLSVRGSLTEDPSLLSRFYESRGAMGRVVENPVLGHGLGVPFSYYDILSRTTVTATFTHNGYLSLWYRFGVAGVALVLYWWGRSIRCGLRAYRLRAAPRVLRLAGLGAAASLVAFVLSAMTSNPFWHKDYLFGFAYITGLACGVYARAAGPPPDA